MLANQTNPAIDVTSTAQRFYSALNTGLRIYHPARDWMRYTYDSFNENPYQPRVAQKVVGLAFLSIVAAWDEFVEQLFLGYMAGGGNRSGYSPTLAVGPCRNRSHATRVLGAAGGGDPHRLLRWSDWTWVNHVASVYFRNGAPFSSLSELMTERLGDAQIIRNRVAHDSLKARRQFKRCVNSLLGTPLDSPLRRGFSPGEFLANTAREHQFPPFTIVSRSDHTWGDYFENYVSMYFEAVATLCPVLD
jgi:hypothetical protein